MMSAPALGLQLLCPKYLFTADMDVCNCHVSAQANVSMMLSKNILSDAVC